MKRRKLIAGFLAVVTVVTVWLFVSRSSRRPGAEIPVTLIGFTNDTTGIPTARHKGTNAIPRFAVFSIQNPTRRDFFCYIGPVFWEGGQVDAQPSQSGDFDLPPGAGATFAVPEPDVSQAWRCAVVLCHRDNYPRWKFAVVRFAERCGLDMSEHSWFAVSPEITR
jgi:hypothetical protein